MYERLCKDKSLSATARFLGQIFIEELKYHKKEILYTPTIFAEIYGLSIPVVRKSIQSLIEKDYLIFIARNGGKKDSRYCRYIELGGQSRGNINF